MSSPGHPKPILRFAPSPNGRLHLGHAASALLNAQLALTLGGTMLVRIEDIDIVRCRPEFVEAALADLRWLGLDWPEPVRRQSQHFDAYLAAARHLAEAGLLYPCDCTRSRIADCVAAREAMGDPWPRDPDGAPHYPGTCRARADLAGIGLGQPGTAWRLDMKKAMARIGAPLEGVTMAPDGSLAPRIFDPSVWGDAVLLRKDVPASYHLAVVTDDALQGITHVVRGRDLEAATGSHLLLQRLLGLPHPVYRHHALILDDGGDKLAKSRGSETLADLRARGISAQAVRAMAGFPDWQAP